MFPEIIYPVNTWGLNWLVIPPIDTSSIPLHTATPQICEDHLYVSWKPLFSKLTSPALPAFPIWCGFKSPFSPITLLWTNYRSFVHLSVCFPKLQPELPRWPGTYRGKIVLICSEKEVAHRMERILVIQPAGHVFKLLTVYPSAM